MSTAADTAVMMTSFGSDPKQLMLISARPLIVAELSNEAVNTFVTLNIVRVLEGFDDLVHPQVSRHQSQTKKLTLAPFPDGDDRQGYKP